MQPLMLTLKGFRGIRDGLGFPQLTLDLERLAGDAQLIAIAGPNGSGKTTVMDNLTPYNLLASRAPGGPRRAWGLILLRPRLPARAHEGPGVGPRGPPLPPPAPHPAQWAAQDRS